MEEKKTSLIFLYILFEALSIVALCSVDYIRSKIYTSLTDLELSNLIDEVSEETLALCETTDSSSPIVIQIGKYLILASTLRKMKTTGELADSYETPEYKQQNTTDKDIEYCEQKASLLISRYKASRASYFSSPTYQYSINYSEGD